MFLYWTAAMGEPRDIDRAPLSPAAARRVLVAIETEDAGDTGSREGKAYPRITGYTIERELGRGAGGVTYLAHKAGSEAKIALKVLHAHPGDGRASQRAWRELDTLQQVRVPSVPRLLDYGTTDHSMYIATEFIDGTPLSELYTHARPADLAEMRERVRLLEKIARAAHSLHERGVIHRDLKPSNVIVAPAATNGAGERPGGASGRAGESTSGVGEPFIIDLGIALIDAPDLHQTLTQDGQPVGTPAFMAPEQARGKREEISTRSDIYSLGAIGYWLCTGETPHDLVGVTLHEAIRRIGSAPPREPRAITPQLPKPLAAVLSKACAPRPTDRYPSATDFAADLSRWVDREPVLATRPGVWRRALRRAERHPVLTTVLVCIALGGSILGSSILVRDATVQRLYEAPFRVVHDEEHGLWTRLESRSESVLAEWRWREPNQGVAGLFDAGTEISPRQRVYTIITGSLDLDPDLDGQLCVWDANEPTRLLWQTRGTADYIRAPRDPVHLPPATSADFLNSPESYAAGNVSVAEVFEQSPAMELIVTHNHPRFDPTAIRVYSAEGEVLFEAWHWGAASNPLWLADERIIVLQACNNEHRLPEYGVEGSTFGWARVVFALKPEFNVARRWVNPNLAGPGEAAEWYRCVRPLETMKHVSGPDPAISIASEAESPVRIHFVLAARGVPEARLTLGLNARGETVAIVPSDPWRQLAHPLREMNPHLGDLPTPPSGE